MFRPSTGLIRDCQPNCPDCQKWTVIPSVGRKLAQDFRRRLYRSFEPLLVHRSSTRTVATRAANPSPLRLPRRIVIASSNGRRLAVSNRLTSSSSVNARRRSAFSSRWPKLRVIGMTVNRTLRDGKETIEGREFCSSRLYEAMTVLTRNRVDFDRIPNRAVEDWTANPA
jgi:hypothetical protein